MVIGRYQYGIKQKNNIINQHLTFKENSEYLIDEALLGQAENDPIDSMYGAAGKIPKSETYVLSGAYMASILGVGMF